MAGPKVSSVRKILCLSDPKKTDQTEILNSLPAYVESIPNVTTVSRHLCCTEHQGRGADLIGHLAQPILQNG